MFHSRLDQASTTWAARKVSRLRLIGRRARAGATLLAGLVLVATFFATEVRAQSPLPVTLTNETLSSVGIDLLQTIDLNGLPGRPTIIVDVTPQPNHPDIEFEIEFRDVTPDPGDFGSSIGCPISVEAPPGVDSWLSEPAVGAQHLEADLFFCSPELNFWNAYDADVRVRVLDFGSGGAPATFTVNIRAVTTVPTELLPVQVSGPQTVTAGASQDTVIYADNLTDSNGAGSFLWAGTHTQIANPFGFLRYPRNTLLQFSSLGSLLPPNAAITQVELGLVALGTMGIGGPVGVFAVAPGSGWAEGFADASGDEFFGTTPSSSSSANWTRRAFAENWIMPGGDTTTSTALSALSITSTGLKTFSSPELNAAMQTMVDTDDFLSGFKIVGPSGIFASEGVAFASSSYPLVFSRPRIQVDYDQTEPYAEGRIDGDLVDYLDEGENFRWIYDDYDGVLDGIFTTLIGGVCEEASTNGSFTTPYTYSYTGTPGYIGHDCCSWRIESAEAQIVGTGQALFFHNLDVTDPVNMPPDADADGMLDPCDNCPNTPNGPFLGTCMVGTTIAGGTCQSDLECGSGETCDLSQLDDDGDTFGNACPEPSFGIGVMLGSMLLVSGQRSRRRSA